MNKKGKHIWLIAAVLILVFAALLLILLGRGCNFLENNSAEQSTNTDGLQPSFTVGFEDVVIDTQEATGTTGTTDASQATGATEQNPAVTVPVTSQPEQTTPSSGETQTITMNYAQYMAMTADQQQAFYDENFKDDPIAFAQWFQKIKQEFDEENPAIIVTGPINIEDYLD